MAFSPLARPTPRAVQRLLIAIVALSLVNTVAPLDDWLALLPAKVWHGQIWRLATWPFVQTGAWSLILEIGALWWFGSDLCVQWGARRFLRYLALLVAVAGAATCVVALVSARAWYSYHLGGWILSDSAIIAWAYVFPSHAVTIQQLVTLRGDQLAYGTCLVVVAFALFGGVVPWLPELFACGAALLLRRHA